MSRLSKNILYNLLGQGAVLLIGFVGIKLIFQNLGAEAFGIIQFAALLRSIGFTVLSLGIASTTTREVSAHLKQEPNYVQALIRTASLFYWGTAGVMGALVFFGAPFLVTQWIRLNSMDIRTATQILQILGISTLTVFPVALYSSLLRGVQRMEFDNLLDVGATALQQFGTVVLLGFGQNVFVVVYWMAAVWILEMIGYQLICLKFFPLRALVPAYAPAVVRRNFSYAANTAGTSVLGLIQNTFDKIMTSKFLPLADFGIYTFSFSLVSKIKLGTLPVSQAAFPSFAHLFAKGDRAALMRQYYKLQDLMCLGALPFLAAIVYAIHPLFTYLFDLHTAQAQFLPILLLSLGTYLNGTLQIPDVFARAAGRPDIGRRFNMYAVLIILPFQAVLIYFFGLIGAGAGWLFYNLFAYAYAMPKTARECMEIPVGVFYKHVARIFALGCLVYGGILIFLAALNALTPIYLILGFGLACLVYGTGALRLMRPELRQTLVSLLQRVCVRWLPSKLPAE
jgi:O-antigen/teichoic acid export membrane protein